MATTLPTAATRSQMRRKAHRLSGHGESMSTVTPEPGLLSTNLARTPVTDSEVRTDRRNPLVSHLTISSFDLSWLYQPASARNAFTSAANRLWCWKRKPWAESG